MTLLLTWLCFDFISSLNQQEIFDAVVVCNGRHAIPIVPDSLPGQQLYKGTIMHCRSYRDNSAFANKCVVVVGMGNSGVDSAVDLTRVAKKVRISCFRFTDR